jgi:Amt family ammonium transporter
VGLKVLEFFKVDDVVGAIPAHLFAGIWGTIAVCIAAGGNLGVQLIGIAAIGAFVFGSSFVLWAILKAVMGARVTQNVEELGQDLAELGIEAYPEFMIMPDSEDFGDYDQDK